jgi:hypothetical protein
MSTPFARRPRDVTFSLEAISVMLGMPAGRDLPALTVKSMLGTQAICRDAGVPFQLGMVTGSAVIQWARDEVVDLFLQSQATRLFWIDSDMVWQPEQFMRLLALTAVHDVVCAAYPAKREQPTFFVNWGAGGMAQNEFGLLEIKGVGLGFTVMTRKVVEELAARAPRTVDDVAQHEMASVFRVGRTPEGRRQGEDMALFQDIRSLGYTVWMDPQTDLGHIGPKTYTGSIRDAFAAA